MLEAIEFSSFLELGRMQPCACTCACACACVPPDDRHNDLVVLIWGNWNESEFKNE